MPASVRDAIPWMKIGPITRSAASSRSEEHTSELQSRLHLVCHLLLEKKNLVSDLRYGLRMLLREPALTLASAVVLAFGMGATTAIFTLVHSVLLEPLPYSKNARPA